LLASAVGAAVRSRVSWRPATFVDSVAGAAVSVLSVLLIAWLIGSAVVNAPFAMVTTQVNRSAVLHAVDKVMPSAARTMFSDFRSLLASGPYVQVFGALGAEPQLTVAPPDPAVLNSAGLARSRNSIVKVMGVAPSCSRRIEGSGFVISRNHVLTNAHVVAGVTENQAVFTRMGDRKGARVVLFDPERDVAVLYVPHLNARPLAFTGPASMGANAIVADVEPGNSGGPLLATNGQVYGVVFAAAVGVKNTGYALTASEVRSDVSAGSARTSRVSTQA